MSIGQGAKGEAQRAKSKEQRAKALGMSEIEAAIQAHHERNCELLKLIASKGVDPSMPRAIDLHFWASSESAAQKLSAKLEGPPPVIKTFPLPNSVAVCT